MATIDLNDAKANPSDLVDRAMRGEPETITRHGEPAAALVSIEAAGIAHAAMKRDRPSLVGYLKAFPGGELERDGWPSRDVEL
ncbi:prevent-host-death protein [Methylosinus sp. R-45379]|uniref:type II toxin-antitoxin system Phd/YefM family antitoxin n=1 Tax=unclassified Methylosinus TaxID=2624500 RepID=UPI000463E4FF|nr:MULTISPECIES: type II toxin-antitoxin system Phd/YefM family antitoxin [unclassified Methylosinus]OAI24009.1 prevent-host-death protein [Methylosinus sp. R-45379]